MLFPSVLPARPKPEWCRNAALDRFAKRRKSIILANQLRRGDDFMGLCMAVGYIAQNWAMLEQDLDMWIAMIYHGIGGRATIDPQIPISFARKIKFLRRAFWQISALKPYADEARTILDGAKALSKDRNDLVHGSLMSLKPQRGRWKMAIFDFETPKDRKHWHVVREFEFDPRKFQEIEEKLVPLAGQAGTLGLRMNRELGLHSVVRTHERMQLQYHA